MEKLVAISRATAIIMLCTLIATGPASSMRVGDPGSADAQQRAAWANIVAAGLPVFAANGAKAFDEYLRDYPHTRFSHLRGTAFTTDDPMTYIFVICGEYNAPNGFGGYDGWKPFELKSPMNGKFSAVRFKNVTAPVLMTHDLGYYLIDADCGVTTRWIPMDSWSHFTKSN